MDTDCDLLYKEEVNKIVSCAFEVSNILGPELAEKLYERALCQEFRYREYHFDKQKKFNVIYKNIIIGEYIPDLIVFDKIIIEIKSVNKLTQVECAQILNYLRITGYKVGLILNFKHRKLEWKRFVL